MTLCCTTKSVRNSPTVCPRNLTCTVFSRSTDSPFESMSQLVVDIIEGADDGIGDLAMFQFATISFFVR